MKIWLEKPAVIISKLTGGKLDGVLYMENFGYE